MDLEKYDPLVFVYDTIRQYLTGLSLKSYDDFPDASVIKKELPAANIKCVSSSIEKAFMREFVPHKIVSRDDGAFTVIYESARFEYYFDITFFDNSKGSALCLATKFMTLIDTSDGFENRLLIDDSGKELVERMQILVAKPPQPPSGEPDLYAGAISLSARGKLFIWEVVPAFDIKKFRIKAINY